MVGWMAQGRRAERPAGTGRAALAMLAAAVVLAMAATPTRAQNDFGDDGFGSTAFGQDDGRLDGSEGGDEGPSAAAAEWAVQPTENGGAFAMIVEIDDPRAPIFYLTCGEQALLVGLVVPVEFVAAPALTQGVGDLEIATGIDAPFAFTAALVPQGDAVVVTARAPDVFLYSFAHASRFTVSVGGGERSLRFSASGSYRALEAVRAACGVDFPALDETVD